MIESDEFCGTPDSENSDPPGVYSKSIDPNHLASFDYKVYNVFYWNIVLNDSLSIPQLAEVDYLRAHNQMNEAFGNYNICFNLKGYEVYANSTYETWPSNNFSPLLSHMKNIGKYKENAINVYLYRSSASSGVSFSKDAIGVGKWQFKNDPGSQVLIHEMGHQLGLRHTYAGWIGASCEHVTRDINDPNYNATDINGAIARGDRIHDTNAAPDLRQEQREHGIKALRDNIGYTYTVAYDILTNSAGFASHPDAVAIENALLNYGFTQTEVNGIKYNGVESFAYFNLTNCLYEPDNRVNDPDSPFFKDCQKTPYQFFVSDARNYMSSTGRECQNQFTTGQGISMHEYIEGDNTNYFNNRLAQHPLDLYVRDHPADIGQEPNIHTEIFWYSPDIWVRNYDDNGQIHQNPDYGTSPNYVYVRVTNKSCVASTGEETLELYWAKADTGAGTSIWTGGVTGGPNNIPLGGQVGVLNIPVIEPGQEAIVQFAWQVPNPEDFFGITVNDWHFCLLTRIVAPNDPMASPASPWNAKLNNNITAKNVTVVNTTGPSAGYKPGGAVSIGNLSGEGEQTFDFHFFSNELDSAIFDEAEVLITLSPGGFNRWMSGGSLSENIEVYNEEEGELLITSNHARLLNMQYGPDEWDILYLSFNFLTEEVTGKAVFEYHLVQKDTEGEAIGGEVYQIIRDPEREHFVADGDSYENTFGETELTATDIGEPAVYNWYAPKGQLIHSGKDFTFIPEVPGDYLLEVIAEADGHKDYFTLTIAVNAAQAQIISLSPNPATHTVSVEYQINQNATTASLTVVSFFGNIQNNYPIDLTHSNTTTNINLLGYPVGYYGLILMVDGQAVHAKQLLIN